MAIMQVWIMLVVAIAFLNRFCDSSSIITALTVIIIYIPLLIIIIYGAKRGREN